MKYELSEIIDTSKNQKILDSFCNAVGIAAAIIDLEGNILVGANWQRMCTDFHRQNELTCKKCIESDTTISNRLQEGEKYSLYNCRNGLADAASPIIINGEHVANAFVGQFLLEPPDVKYFKKQAKEYGFDEKEYLDALSEIPIIKEDQIKRIINFLVNYSEIVAEIALDHLKQLETEKKTCTKRPGNS